MATVKKITAKDLKKIIYEEKVKLGLITKKKINESSIVRRQILALRYLKHKAKNISSKERLKWINEVRVAIKKELLRSL